MSFDAALYAAAALSGSLLLGGGFGLWGAAQNRHVVLRNSLRSAAIAWWWTGLMLCFLAMLFIPHAFILIFILGLTVCASLAAGIVGFLSSLAILGGSILIRPREGSQRRDGLLPLTAALMIATSLAVLAAWGYEAGKPPVDASAVEHDLRRSLPPGSSVDDIKEYLEAKGYRDIAAFEVSGSSYFEDVPTSSEMIRANAGETSAAWDIFESHLDIFILLDSDGRLLDVAFDDYCDCP
jgi:hypothetical protein